MNPADNIYDPEFISALFDEMSRTYDRVNRITSFGFNVAWRRQLIQKAGLQKGQTVYDLMGGMGELWPFILPQVGIEGKLISLDLSRGMSQMARERRRNYADHQIEVLQENLFSNSLPDGKADVIVSGFGLKTFPPAAFPQLGDEIYRLLKPGGTFALVEISDPVGWPLRGLYNFYLNHIIPILGRVFLGNPENYRMLGIYAGRFGNCGGLVKPFREAGLETDHQPIFHGCASLLFGRKPEMG
ncbi:MAG: class I SAM-dependent methyltransferase [Bacteroidia bacterium]|nr:class I SAM-dependent methyltransferase [Bacteroidia bacterium]